MYLHKAENRETLDCSRSKEWPNVSAWCSTRDDIDRLIHRPRRLLFRFSIGIRLESKTCAISTLTSFENCTGSSSKWTAICCEDAYSAVTGTKVRFQWVKNPTLLLLCFFFLFYFYFPLSASSEIFVARIVAVQRIEPVSRIWEKLQHSISHASVSSGIRLQHVLTGGRRSGYSV